MLKVWLNNNILGFTKLGKKTKKYWFAVCCLKSDRL